MSSTVLGTSNNFQFTTKVGVFELPMNFIFNGNETLQTINEKLGKVNSFIENFEGIVNSIAENKSFALKMTLEVGKLTAKLFDGEFLEVVITAEPFFKENELLIRKQVFDKIDVVSEDVLFNELNELYPTKCNEPVDFEDGFFIFETKEGKLPLAAPILMSGSGLVSNLENRINNTKDFFGKLFETVEKSYKGFPIGIGMNPIDGVILIETQGRQAAWELIYREDNLFLRRKNTATQNSRNNPRFESINSADFLRKLEISFLELIA